MLVAALRTTVSEVLNLVLLLALLMYIFGIMGYYFFGSAEYAVGTGRSTADWDSLSSGCMSLFVFVTADGWTELQERLDDDGYAGSKMFTVVFLLVGHFIFINIFIGVVIRNIEQAAQEEASWQKQMRASSYLAKKRAAIAEQDRNLNKKMEEELSPGGSTEGRRTGGGLQFSDIRNDDGPGGKSRQAAPVSDEKALVVLPRPVIAHPMWATTYVAVLRRQRSAMGNRLALQHSLARQLTAGIAQEAAVLGREELQLIIARHLAR